MGKVYEVSEWIPRWVHEHCLVEADGPEQAIEKYLDGDILDYVPERDVASGRVEGRDSYGVEVRPYFPAGAMECTPGSTIRIADGQIQDPPGDTPGDRS